MEKRDDEHRSAENEMLRMRQSLDSMQEQLVSVGKEQISAEQSLRRGPNMVLVFLLSNRLKFYV